MVLNYFPVDLHSLGRAGFGLILLGKQLHGRASPLSVYPL
jgi:hypothetical protein